MTHRFSWKKQGVVAALLLLGAFSSTLTLAQRPGGMGGPGGFGGGRMGGMRRQPTVANVPVAALTAGLKLTPAQQTKIDAIQKQLQQQRSAMMPGGMGGPGGGRMGGGPGGPGGGRMGGPGGPGGGGRMGGPGGPGGMSGGFNPAMMQKMQAMNDQAVHGIEAVLDARQKKALPGFMKDVQTFRAVQIPIELYSSLKLTPDQKSKLTAIADSSQKEIQAGMQAAQGSGNFGSMRQTMQAARQKASGQADAVLTASQKAMIEKYRKDHPPRGRGFGAA